MSASDKSPAAAGIRNNGETMLRPSAPANHLAPVNHLSSAALRCRSALSPSVTLPRYPRSRLKAGIAHIGVGNFHRVHQAAYIERCLHLPGHESWAICGIGLGDSPGSDAKAAAFARQDNLYSMTELSPDGSAKSKVIGAMIDYLHAPSDRNAVLRRLADPDIRIVSLTITEGGYHIDEASGLFQIDDPEIAADLRGRLPRTAFGLIVAALRLRMERGVPAFTVLSCDNLRRNGDTARHAVLSYARALDATVAEWIAAKAAFPNSMVDRIAPAVSAQQHKRVCALLGVDDAIPAIAEPFSQWVLEDCFSAGRPDLAAAGAVFTDDVEAYEALKGRMLNASHMLLAYPALLCGYRHVPEAMHDPLLRRLLTQFMEHDVIPYLRTPAGVSLHGYKATVLRRFANPAVADQLERVAHDGAAKIPIFHSATIATMVAGKADVKRAAFLLASFASYLDGKDCRAVSFTVVEPHLTQADRDMLAQDDPLALLDTSPFRALELRRQTRFAREFAALRDMIKTQGIRKTLAFLV
jgi:mannitol 2-dehydrogenase